jgi:hypothetical protein
MELQKQDNISVLMEWEIWHVLDRYLVRLSAGTLSILTDVFHLSRHSLPENSWILSRLGHNSFILNYFQFIIDLTILRYSTL